MAKFTRIVHVGLPAAKKTAVLRYVQNKALRLVFGTVVIATMMLAPALLLADTAAEPPLFLPVVSRPSQPIESYEDDFGEDITPWAARRWNNDADFQIQHDDGCDDGHCGFQEILVEDNQAYVISSPMIAVEAPFPYRIETRAKLLKRQDGHEYGLIFGGDSNGGVCPAADFSSCFTQYYEFRVRYRDDNGDRFLEWKLKRIDSHDGNNQNEGPDIIDWKRADDVDPDGWVKWEVEVHNNGQMHIFADNVQQAGSARDDTYIHNNYFGVIGRTSAHGDSHVIFDMVKVENSG